MKRTSILLGSFTGLALLFSGCSGQDQTATVDNPTGGSGPMLGTAGGAGISLGGSGNSGGGIGTSGGTGTAGVGTIPGSHDDGTNPLTPEQVTQIETSACAD